MDSNINQRLILVGVHLSQFCFHKLILEAGGEFKMFNSQVACAKKFQPIVGEPNLKNALINVFVQPIPQ